MRFAPTDDQIALADAVSDLLMRECPPDAVRGAWETPDGRVPGLWDRLVEMGVVGICAAEEHGGLGLSMLDLVGVLVETGRAAAPEPVVDVAAVAVPLLDDVGGELAGTWVPSLVSGEASAAVGLERGVGAGNAVVENAAAADVLLLGATGVSGDAEVHLVEAEAVTTTDRASVDGSRRLAEVDWEPTSATRIAGREALGVARDRGNVATAAVLVGLGAAMLERTVEYAKEREQFGKPIGSFQAVKHHLATAALGLEYARPVVDRGAYTLVYGGDTRRDSSIAMAYAAEAAHLAGRTALQVHGAIGYTVEYDLHLWMKRVWALESAWGDAAFHREQVARRVLDSSPGAQDWTDKEHA
ncbi:MAG: acyl-CoA/acyl-ACP dehydrogenase [Acidimicrobiia bacterium]|nr:acyl-CoA/acyl-ACP dehydrogenase [Acidimicrobiia bacterium]